MKELFKRTKMLDEAKVQSKARKPIVELPLFLLVFMIASSAQAILLYPALFYYIFSQKSLNDFFVTSQIDIDAFMEAVTKIISEMPDWLMIYQLFVTVTLIIASIIYCRCVEKRSLASMGFRKRRMLFEYFIGLLIGVVLFAAVIGIGIAVGAFSFKGSLDFSIPVIIMYLVGYVIQGASEEVLVHGYYMTSLSRSTNSTFALVSSSLVFAFLHYANSNVSLVALINLFLFGLLMGMYVLKRGNIWGACAIHAVWNFLQGNVFGMSVSGMSKTMSIFSVASKDGFDLVTGGEFGPEGGLITTFIILLALGALYMTKTNPAEISEMTFDDEQQEEQHSENI